MYGGYGNIWNQGGSQWGGGNVPNPNQLPIQNQQNAAQTFQLQQQQNMMSYGGNFAGVANPAGGAMGWGAMGAANPFMNYGGNTQGYGMPTTTANTAAWLGNQQFQLHQNFPGGRPPLPPGPPPPDNNDKIRQNQFGSQSQNTQAPPLPPSLVPSNVINQQPAPPPPPPPPPPSQQQYQNATGSGGHMSGRPDKLMNLEDAYNIIKNVAAYGMLPNSTPLAPLASLNVSEELFGSKSSNKGIPGLDMEEEDKPVNPAGPEVVDLEKEVEKFNKQIAEESIIINKSGSQNNSSFTSIEGSKPDNIENKSEQQNGKRLPQRGGRNELNWELRPDVKAKEWSLTDSTANGEANKDNNGRQRMNHPERPLGMNKSNTNEDETNLVENFEEDKSFFNDKPSSIPGSNSKEDKNRVQIPLEAVDGKELIYDRKILKQFDQKFREWENEFEKWKLSNQHHPNKQTYTQYLDQWNLWREQLIEQRRAILDKMTKAKMDSKEILMAKFESLDADDQGSQASSVGASSSRSQPRDAFPVKDEPQQKPSANFNDTLSENPFETATRPTDTRRKPAPPPPIVRDEDPGPDDKTKPIIPPLMPGLESKNKTDRPVERILRDGGKNRNEKNMFDNDFNQNQSDQKPFGRNTSFEDTSTNKNTNNVPQRNQNQSDQNPFARNACFEDTSINQNAKNVPQRNQNVEPENVRIPFEWSLASKNKEENNPFDIPQSSNNPFMQPSGPNPFEMKSDPKLPSLMDYIKQTNLDFCEPNTSYNRNQSSNPFAMSSTSVAESRNTAPHNSLYERIPRDPQGNKQQAPMSNAPSKSLRLEANPTGFPLLIASKDQSPPPRREADEISQLFSRDRGPHQGTDNYDSNTNMMNMDMDDDDFVEDAEVIDYGAGAEENSMDSLDLPRGEKLSTENEEDGDFCLEDSEVIDYSQGIPPQESGHGQYPGPPDPYGGPGGYPEEFESYPPYYEAGLRGRGRGYPGWMRGQPRGPPPGHPFGRGGGAPEYPPEFGQQRGRGYPRGGLGRGIRGAPPQQEWFQHDSRDLRGPVPSGGDNQEIVELSPSPEPKGPPGIKIAPPNPDFERNSERRRSRSRERYPRDRDRSRSRSRERVSRRGRDETERRGEDSPYGSRRDRDRRSPDRRGRHDDRDQRRDKDRNPRDRERRGRSKSRSRSPNDERNPIVRNPLFPSASAGMLGSHSASNPPAPRYQTVLIEDILNKPGRTKRPPKLVVFMRGLPGSGKSHIVKLIKEREVEMGGKAPRILSLDNYFITEMEKKEKDPVTGVEVKTTVMEYEYDEEREPLYRAQLVRQFKKTLDEGYFSFVIVDCVNEYVRQFEEMASTATQKRFQVYVSEIEETVDVCVKRNVHKRTKEEIQKISRNWERTPSQFVKLDVRTLLQDEAVQEVEMEDVSDVEADNNEEKALTPAERGKIGPQVVDLEEIEDEDSGDHILQSSKWDTLEHSQEKLNKLDGLVKKRRGTSDEAHVDSAPSIENWLGSNMPEDYTLRRQAQPGQKRVRWADIEAKREQERMREMGFVVGQTDWNKMMDPSGGSSALCRTKFI